ncbi:MAG: hypothetical protein HRF45_05425 [Fimbriimonadia bacterium]|jgi:hypothetical protein
MSVLALLPLVLLAASPAQADDWRSLVPEPFIESRERWVELYWKAWELYRSGIREGTETNGLVSRYVGASDGRVRQIETALLVACGRYGHRAFPTAISLDNFYRKQHADGFMSAGILESDGRSAKSPTDLAEVCPPLLAWAEWQYYLVAADRTRLRFAFPYLSRHFWWLDTNLRTPTGALSPGQGSLGPAREGVVGSMEMTCLQALNARCLAQMARVLDNRTEEQRFCKQADALAGVVNAMLWSQDKGFYCDVDAGSRHVSYEREGRQVPRATLEGAYALFAGIASADRAKKVAARLTDRKGFLQPHSFSTLPADDPMYQADAARLGAVSPTANYLVIRGLEEQGLSEVALLAAENHLEGISRTFVRTGQLWGAYASNAFRPAKGVRPDALGISVCSAVAVLIESVLGIEVDAPAGEVRWNLRQTVKHGIRRLPIGEGTVDLECTARTDRKSPAKLTVRSDCSFTLVVRLGSREVRKAISPGETRFEVAP